MKPDPQEVGALAAGLYPPEEMQALAQVIVKSEYHTLPEARAVSAAYLELVEAAAAFESNLSEWCDSPERDRLRALLPPQHAQEGGER